MNNKILAFALLSLLLLLPLVPNVGAAPPTSPTALIIDTINAPETLDPAWSYDTASSEVIMNVYETLLFFNVEWNSPGTPTQAPGPYSAGKIGQFVPQLATAMPTITGDHGHSITPRWKNPNTGVDFYWDRPEPLKIYYASPIVKYDGIDYNMYVEEAINEWEVFTNHDFFTQASSEADANIVIYTTPGTPDWKGKTDIIEPADPRDPRVWKMTVQFAYDDANYGAPGTTAEQRATRRTNTAKHEFGHVLLLGHNPDAGHLMFTSGPDGWNNLVYPYNDEDGVTLQAIWGDEVELSRLHWYFPIRTGVKFHFSGNVMTPQDVEYSFERALVQDRSGGPTWMLCEPLLASYWASPPSGLPPDMYDIYGPPNDLWGVKISSAIQSDSTGVWFNLGKPYPELAFKQILAQSWSSVIEKAWAIAEGDLNTASVPGGWSNWQYIWNTWHDPPMSFLEDAIGSSQKDGGTGPYKMDYWTPLVGYSVVKFDAYWNGWPAPISGHPMGARLPGYVSRITWNEFQDWTTRRARFLAGESDMAYVPRVYRDQVLGLTAADGELIRCFYRSKASGEAPFVLSLDAFHMTLNLSSTSPYGGTLMGLTRVSSPSFSVAGMPLNLFGIDPQTGKDEGLNVRKGIAYAVDYDWFQNTVNLGESEQPASVVIKGLAYNNPANPKYNFDLTKAEYYLKLAWGGVDSRAPGGSPPSTPVLPEDKTKVTPGPLWNTGMSFKVTYNTGNVAREMAANEIANKINSLNPGKFNLATVGLTWGSVYLPAMLAHRLPIFINGWTSDFADPHDFVHPFMHSQGTLARSQSYSNPFVDALVEQGIATPDSPWFQILVNPAITAWVDRNWNGILDVGDWAHVDQWYEVQSTLPNLIVQINRQIIYYELQELYYEDVPSVPIAQVLMRHFEQPWIRSWYYNAMYGGSLTPGTDSTGPSTPAIYAYHIWKAKTHCADINWDGTVDILDWSALSSSWTGPPRGAAYFLPQCDLTGGVGGTTGSNEGPVTGIPNGAVEIDDLSMVSAYWD